MRPPHSSTSKRPAIGGWILLLTLGISSSMADERTVVISGSDSSLYLQVPVPSGQRLDAKRAWQLQETSPSQTKFLPAELIPAIQRDGTAAKDAQVLVASVAPSSVTQAKRAFKLVPSDAEPAPAFRWTAIDQKSLGLWQGTRPVLVYNHGILSHAAAPSDRNRSTYLHPIYGLDGEVLTDDFPKDHFHHRGLFWAWPHIQMNGAEYDLWDLRGISQRFERWLDRRAGSAVALLGVENGWYVGDRKVLQERVWLRVYPASPNEQILDAEFSWIPLGQPMRLSGAPDKSYGGLTLRFAPRTNTVITTVLGNKAEDLAMTPLPWADLTAQFQGAPQPSGAAVFIAPDHPDYPPTWLTRHYGVLCVGWPGVNGRTFADGEVIHCRYRIWIHRGAAESGQIAAAYRAYDLSSKAEWTEKGP